jgi:hypothetical protein
MQKRWPLLLVLVFVLAAALFLLLCNPASEQSVDLSDEQHTLASLQKVDDFPLYVMTYYGDYGFDDYLKKGIASDIPASLLMGWNWGCTTFSTANPEGDLLVGRNFDWHDHPALLLFTDPPNAYSAVTMVDAYYLNFTKEVEPSQQALQEALNAPYWSFDGMNEHGLAVSIMAVPHVEPTVDPSKVTIGSLDAIRLVLDYAKDVDEAIDLLGKYNIDFTGGPPLHYLIADREGNSIILEFIDGEMIPLRSEEPWQVSTNFLITEEKPEGTNAPCWRYNQAYRTLQDAGGNISMEEAMAILESVSQKGSYPTIWSIIYNRSNGDINVVVGQQFNQMHPFELELAD